MLRVLHCICIWMIAVEMIDPQDGVSQSTAVACGGSVLLLHRCNSEGKKGWITACVLVLEIKVTYERVGNRTKCSMFHITKGYKKQ